MNNYQKSVVILSPNERNVYTVENSKLRLPKASVKDALIFGTAASFAIAFPLATVLGISGVVLTKICKRLDAYSPPQAKEPQGLQPVTPKRKAYKEETEFTHYKKTIEYHD